MTREKADLINMLVEIEDQIDELWDYHQDNPNRIKVEEKFDEMQKVAILIQSQLDSLGDVDDDDRF